MIEKINEKSLEELIALRQETFNDLQLLSNEIDGKQNEIAYSNYNKYIGKIIHSDGGYMRVKSISNENLTLSFVGPTIYPDEGIIRIYDEDRIYEDPENVELISDEEFANVMDEATHKMQIAFKSEI